MAKRHRKGTDPIDELRSAIDCLPVSTRAAMIEGLQAGEPIIAGAYVDGRGGVCPMLAAHRRGARTNFLSFARAWDRFARARHARRATPRELAILTGQLQSSLLTTPELDLQRAIGAHRELLRRQLAEQADPPGEIQALRLAPSRREQARSVLRSVAAACGVGGGRRG
jgi:hypothetical protein